jgi:hypothetical protein
MLRDSKLKWSRQCTRVAFNAEAMAGFHHRRAAHESSGGVCHLRAALAITASAEARRAKAEAIQRPLRLVGRITSRSLSSGAHSRDSVARNDVERLAKT